MNSTEHRFKSWDGVELFYRAWIPSTPARNALLLFHRGHEHSARWQQTVDDLKLDDVAVFAWDQRGHGNSPGERGSAENLAAIVKDADAFARHVCREHNLPSETVPARANGVGPGMAAAWVHDFAPPIRALVLGVPAFRVKLYVPLAVPLLRIKQKLLGPGYVKSYVKASMLTSDPREIAAYQADPMIFRQIAVNILLDLHDTSTRLLDDAGAITAPILMLAAGCDWVVKFSAQEKFFRRLGSSIKQLEVFPDFHHALFHEKGRGAMLEKIRAFLVSRFAEPAKSDDLLAADQGGYTRTEYDLLRTPSNLRWKITRKMTDTAGQLSDGIRLGCKSGFDSGVMLDYVYKNRPRGKILIGRIIDYFYLNSIGWRGIRVRRQNLQNVLRNCIAQTHQSGKPVHILDIASGPGRYVLETIKSMPEIPASAHLRDYKQENLDAAKQLAQSLDLSQVSIERGDAFDRASLAAISPRPTIGIVSGLYELFPSNEPIIRSLASLADALEPESHLIYTNQPWHPQMEFIARALTNREGQPWIMRRRTQAEMDQLVAAAGFEKISQEIDPWGVFTICVARRKSA